MSGHGADYRFRRPNGSSLSSRQALSAGRSSSKNRRRRPSHAIVVVGVTAGVDRDRDRERPAITSHGNADDDGHAAIEKCLHR